MDDDFYEDARDIKVLNDGHLHVYGDGTTSSRSTLPASG
jgi:hypothetical protein